ncbi:MAG: pilus assembly protein PilP [Gammaproteobacteria bacterium]
MKLHPVIAKGARCLALFGLTLGISACGGDMQDLRAYLDEVKARPGGRIEPLPEIRPTPTFAYEAESEGVRSPFAPDVPQVRVSDNPDAVQSPDANRTREFLEQFPLDTLRMVGTLAIADGAFGLVQTADGLIHRVRVGNHMGQNFGPIMAITESNIQLVEIISDGIGGYLERPAAVALTD